MKLDLFLLNQDQYVKWSGDNRPLNFEEFNSGINGSMIIAIENQTTYHFVLYNSDNLSKQVSTTLKYTDTRDMINYSGSTITFLIFLVGIFLLITGKVLDKNLLTNLVYELTSLIFQKAKRIFWN
jgi:hypothetical protein